MRRLFPSSKKLTNLVYSSQVEFIRCETCKAGPTKARFNNDGFVVGAFGGATLVKGANGRYRCREHFAGVLRPRRERRTAY